MSGPDAIAAAGAILGDRARSDEPIGPHTTYRVGGPAALFCDIDGPETLERCAAAVADSGIDVLVVGNGSNLLVCDSGFPGLVIRLGAAYAQVRVDGTQAVVGGAAQLPVAARQTVAAGLGGFEWAVGVPGTIGGAVRMNAGGHGSDMAANLVRVRVFDTSTGETLQVESARLDLGYRRSNIRQGCVVTDATLELVPLASGPGHDSEHVGTALLSEIVRWRRSNQPGGSNAGSVFANAPTASAGELIDRCALKGHRLGTAAVSGKHANFIQADAGGRADDVYSLMVEVRDTVEAKTGVRLHPETVLVGYDAAEFT